MAPQPGAGHLRLPLDYKTPFAPLPRPRDPGQTLATTPSYPSLSSPIWRGTRRGRHRRRADPAASEIPSSMQQVQELRSVRLRPLRTTV